MHLLKDEKLQKEIDDKGYLKLDCLDSDIIKSLQNLVLKSIGENIYNSQYSNFALFASLHEFTTQKARKVEWDIEQIMSPLIQEIFNPVKFHFGNILVKVPNEASYTYPHQDWTFVDQNFEEAYTVWIPLQNTDEFNGTLGFIKASHRYLKKLVGSPARKFYSNCTNNFQLFYSLCKFISLNLGEILIFNGRTVHSAVPNLSKDNRIAISFCLTSKESQLYHYVLSSDDPINRVITRLKVDRDFFSYYTVEKAAELYDAKKLPDGYEIDGVFEDKYEFYSDEFLKSMIEKENLKYNDFKLQGI